MCPRRTPKRARRPRSRRAARCRPYADSEVKDIVRRIEAEDLQQHSVGGKLENYLRFFLVLPLFAGTKRQPHCLRSTIMKRILVFTLLFAAAAALLVDLGRGQNAPAPTTKTAIFA